MKTPLKKIPRNFRLSPEISEELKRRSDVTGIDETRIVEDALRYHFAETMAKAFAEKLKLLKGSHSPFDQPLAPFIDSVNGSMVLTLA